MVSPSILNQLTIIDAGLLDYASGLELQQRLSDQRRQDQVGDHLILLEHPPVITLGQSGGWEDLNVPAAALENRGVALFETNRGGRATFHGPGQLVAYPILKLPDEDLHAYLWKLEEVICRLLTHWGIAAQRVERYPGVWVGSDKIAAVGVAVAGGVTTHGIALNVNTDLDYFKLITPCGIKGRGVTSMQVQLGRPLPLAEVKDSFIQFFSEVFNLKVIHGSLSR